MPNEDLMYKVLTHIETHPQEWDQSVYSHYDPVCGSSFCFAGHAVNMDPTFDLVLVGREFTAFTEGGREEDIEDAAIEVLDITGAQADWLFNGSNNLDRLKSMVKHIVNNDPLDEYSIQ